VQPFDSKVFEGEVRAFTVCGEPVSWCLKKPAADQFLANTRAGASLDVYNPTERDIAMVRTVSQELLKQGIYICGFDIIGGKLSEINVTSPRLLVSSQEAHWGPVEQKAYLEFAERLKTYAR
jgi:glutathione synthase